MKEKKRTLVLKTDREGREWLMYLEPFEKHLFVNGQFAVFTNQNYGHIAFSGVSNNMHDMYYTTRIWKMSDKVFYPTCKIMTNKLDFSTLTCEELALLTHTWLTHDQIEELIYNNHAIKCLNQSCQNGKICWAIINRATDSIISFVFEKV